MECNGNYDYLNAWCQECNQKCKKDSNITTTITISEVHKILQEIKAFTMTATESFYELGLRFKKLKENKAHKIMGFQRWSEFIESYTPYERSHVDSLISVAEKFGSAIEQKASLFVSFRRLREIAPIIKTSEDAIEWLEKAETLPTRGWKDEVSEAKNKIPHDACNHEESETWERCKRCGKFFKL